ncbi:MAG: hypothetical protein EBV20_08970 [Betaproteobacteria bacterium]|jgi:Caspase domain/MORN repeat|nr:hypothetical protein [Betaproteobacteria bacterium]NBP44396.1 hypothetical protein [Betaproteobacteria bacterium]
MKHLFRLLLLLIPLTAVAQSSLPPCPPTGVKHMCFGDQIGRNTEGVEWRYVGEFKNDQRNGQGILTFSDGEKYVGEWVYGFRFGIGSNTYSNGNKYVGEWYFDQRYGEGIEYQSNGVVMRSGKWVNDHLSDFYSINLDLFPFHADLFKITSLRSSNPLKAERDRSRAEAAVAYRRRQEIEERSVQEKADKERRAALVTNQAPAPQRSPTLASGLTERRVALIVGNSKYAHNPLDNPVNDAADLDTTLKNLGFKTTLLRDANITQMRNATRQFADDVASSDVALIFFAGHGIEAKGRNYLIPVSADIKHEYELEDQAYDAGRWLDMLENIKGINKQRVNIVILDACRNNDLSRGWRSSSRGLARMDAPKGTFIAFATAPGKVAMDGAKGQRNSPFTKNLLRTIQTPDMPIELMFKEVRRLVLEDTKDEQVPWDNSSLVGDFVFKRSR